MTLFSVSLPIQVVVRIWDVYFIEGSKTIYRVAIAILKINEKELMKAEDMSELLTVIK